MPEKTGNLAEQPVKTAEFTNRNMCNKLRQRSHIKMKLISRAQAQEQYAPTPEPCATPVEQTPAADLTAQRLQLALPLELQPAIRHGFTLGSFFSADRIRLARLSRVWVAPDYWMNKGVSK
jgi:hypothetical protein